jgi:hypothetical protein
MLPPPLSRYCNVATAAAATAAALPLPPPSCRLQAAAAAAAKLPLPPRRRQAVATVTNAVTMQKKHYTYVGIHNEYTLASTVIGTIRYYKT